MSAVEIDLIGAAGNRLKADRFGDDGMPPVLLVHGGGQTRASWKGAGEVIASQGYCVWSLDARGHGDSDWAQNGVYSMDAMRDDLAAVTRQLGGGVIIVGASMGGIMGLLVAGECDPGLCEGLVLVDVTPRVNTMGRDRIIGFMRANPEGFGSVEDAAEAVAAFNSHRPRPQNTAGLRRNLRERGDRLFWHWDPRFLDTWDFGPAAAHRVEAAACNVSVPILLVHAGMSDVVQDEEAERFREMLPHAAYTRVENAGHMIAGDQNDPFVQAIGRFLANRFSEAR